MAKAVGGATLSSRVFHALRPVGRRQPSLRLVVHLSMAVIACFHRTDGAWVHASRRACRAFHVVDLIEASCLWSVKFFKYFWEVVRDSAHFYQL